MNGKFERVEPFRALTFNRDRVGSFDRVVAPPYDLIDRARQDELYARSPYNVVRLELNRDADPYGAAAATLAQWIDAQIVGRTARPAIYFYTQRFDIAGRRLVRNGMIARIRLEEFKDGRILPHERTFPKAKEDRLRLLTATRVNVSPIFGLCPAGDTALEANAMSEFAVEMDGITRRFGDFTAVDGVTLKIPKGRLYGFLGLNGAGKTTTIRMLTTLLPPSAGSAKLWGHDIVKEPLAVRNLVGLVSDETSESQSTWTAREYLTYFARLRQMKDVRHHVERLLDDVGLNVAFRGKCMGTYSTGMKRTCGDCAGPDGSAEGAVSRRTDARARPAGEARDVEPAAAAGGGRKRDDVSQQPRLARDSQPVRRDQCDLEGQAGVHGRHARTGRRPR